MYALPAASALAIIPHGFFLLYSHRAGKVDQRKAERFERLLEEMPDVSANHHGKVDKAIKATKKGIGRGRWVEMVHFSVTLILVIALTVLVYGEREVCGGFTDAPDIVGLPIGLCSAHD